MVIEKLLTYSRISAWLSNINDEKCLTLLQMSNWASAFVAFCNDNNKKFPCNNFVKKRLNSFINCFIHSFIHSFFFIYLFMHSFIVRGVYCLWFRVSSKFCQTNSLIFITFFDTEFYTSLHPDGTMLNTQIIYFSGRQRFPKLIKTEGKSILKCQNENKIIHVFNKDKIPTNLIFSRKEGDLDLILPYT